MSRIRVVVSACIVALVCMSAVATTAAMANETEFINGEGKALVNNKFTGTSGETKIEATAGTAIKCKQDTVHGVISSKTGGEVTILFTGCTTSGLPCKGGKDASGEAPSGSIYLLAGITLRKINSEEDSWLYTVHKPGTSTAGELEIECSGVKLKIKGSFLSQSFAGGIPSNSFTFASKETKGVQNPLEYETSKGEKVKCGLEASIEGKAFEAAGVEGTETFTFEENAVFVADDIVVFGPKIDFEKVEKGKSKEATSTETFTNEVKVGAIKISGVAFSIKNDLCSGQVVLAGGNCKFGLLFSPAVAGLKPSEVLVFPYTEVGGAKDKFLELNVVIGESI